MKTRCTWVNEDPVYLNYHDCEWGVPLYDDRLLFEMLILEGMQAGLNWLTILKKRENYRACFDNFEAKIIAGYDQKKFEELMQNPEIIRNKLKIKSVITNADAFLRIQQEWTTFSNYIWHFVEGKPIKNYWSEARLVPVTSIISDRLANDLKKYGFKFVGSTICYAFMQAVGMVNDHTMDCFRFDHRIDEGSHVLGRVFEEVYCKNP